MSIEVKDLSFRYKKHKVLSDVSMRAETGELLAVLGPNGVGKSTLFQCILGLLPYEHGTVKINEEDLKSFTAQELARRVAYIPQSHAPVFNFPVFDIVLMGTSSQISAVNMPGKKQMALAEQAIERLGITHLKDRGYQQISGGERQLTLIARALAQNATTLIMDEPTSNLDYGNQIRILSQIKKLTGEGYTVMYSTHNPDQSFLFADKVLALLNGRVVKHGSPQDVITAQLISELYNVEVEVESLCGDKARVCLPSCVVSNAISP
jgi:iron complex transport system ATP-binding protein